MNAIIFDLDDTLYRERQWVVSGYAAVARHLQVAQRLDGQQVFRSLVGAIRRGHRHDAFQQLCVQFDLSTDLIPGWVSLVRSHRPRLTLPRSTRRALAELRPAWRLGVLTNGPPAVQARKSDALDVRPLVDVLVYAAEHGAGKPEAAPFLEVANRIGVPSPRCVFVGDDLWCDIQGARQVGMATIRIRRPDRSTRSAQHHEADAVINCLSEVAEAATHLLENRTDDVNNDLRAAG